jgi:4-amino-4-deoxy-L-arabinose transferase-like glycosyltransferase
MNKLKERLFTHRNILITLFVIFLFLRLFVNYSSTFLGADSIKYLEVARNFPYHTLNNNQLFINHGPLYPYVIYFFALIFQDEFVASLIISLLAASITFFIVYRLFMLLFNNFYVTFVALLFFTLSDELIIAASIPSKESFTVMLIILSIYYYIKAVKFYDKKSLLLASLFGGALALTADHVVFLFPTFILSYIFFNKEGINWKKFIFPNLKYAAIPFIIVLLVYTSWIGVKAYQYMNNEFYPSGLEGAPVPTKGFGVLELLDPVSFEDYDPNRGRGITLRARHYAFGLGYMFNMIPFDIPRGLNLTTMHYLLFPRHVMYMIIIYLPLALIATFSFLYILKDFIRTKKIYNNANLYLIAVFLIFLFPLTQKVSSPRYIYADYLLLYYFIGLGFFMLFKKMKMLKVYRNLAPLAVALLLILAGFWYYHNSYFVLFNEKFVPANRTAEFIRTNLEEDDAIMAQAGYTHKLNYLTKNRILGLPPLSENLLPLIKYYDIDYVVFGNYYTYVYYYYAQESIEFIKEHPEKFELVTSIKEDYGDLTRNNKDEVFIYKVIK